MDIGEDLSDIASNIGRRAVQGARAAGEYFGFAAPNMPREELAYGMNPRRAYFSAALTDLANFAGGGRLQGLGMQANQQQAQHQQRVQAQRAREEYNQQIADAAMANARRGRAGTSAMQNAQAMGLQPGTPEYEAYIRQVTTKPLVNMASDEVMKSMVDQLPGAYERARAAQESLYRYDMMEQLIPQLGNTGPGKNFMTNLRGGLKAIGFGGAAEFIEAVGQVTGVDLFSGDTGAAELFRALGTPAILEQAKELYPVSDRDLAFLTQMAPTLSVSDPNVLRQLINQGREGARGDIQYYDFLRGQLPTSPQAGPELPGFDPTPGSTMSDDEYQRRLQEALGR